MLEKVMQQLLKHYAKWSPNGSPNPLKTEKNQENTRSENRCEKRGRLTWKSGGQLAQGNLPKGGSPEEKQLRNNNNLQKTYLRRKPTDIAQVFLWKSDLQRIFCRKIDLQGHLLEEELAFAETFARESATGELQIGKVLKEKCQVEC